LNSADKALAHIHLAHAGLPLCDEERALCLFVADKLIEAGVTPAALMKAQGFDPAPLDLPAAAYAAFFAAIAASVRRMLWVPSNLAAVVSKSRTNTIFMSGRTLACRPCSAT
jgi:hypothetical protein